jgi:hypothetical protein
MRLHLMRSLGSRNKRLETFLQHRPRQQHPPVAVLATQANVRAKADNLPVIAAAWVRLAQSQDVAQVEFEDRSYASAGTGLSCW